MDELFRNIIIFWFIIGVIIPIFIVWLVIKYIFHLRQRQNEYFLEDLYDVVRDATYDALIDKENANKQAKISHHTYNTNKNR